MTPFSPLFDWDVWTYEPQEWRLTNASGPVALPNKTLALLALLLDRSPALVSKDDILAAVWPGTMVEEGNIAFHVAMLRKTLDVPGGPSCIETVRGRGYRFVTPVTRRAPSAGEADEAAPSITVPAGLPAAARLAPAAPEVARQPATPAIPVTLPAPRVRRWRAAHMLPVLLLACGVSLMGWVAVASAPATVREVAVLPILAAADGQPLDGASEAVAVRLARSTTLEARAVAGGAPSESLATAGRRVGAASVLRVTVTRSTPPWRVTAELARTADGARLWTWAFDVPGDRAALPALLAARVTDGLARHLGVAAMSRTAANTEALTLTLRAREAWQLRTPPSVQQAIALYERAIAIDPSFAPAYAGLADCYNLTMSGLPVDVRARHAKANAGHALVLDPSLAEAHTSLAFSLYKFEWQWAEAESAFRRAIAADSSYALAHHWYGEMLAYLGRFDEAIAELRRAQELEPNSLPVLIDLAGPLLHSGRVADARAVVEEASNINPMFHGVPGRMAEVLAAEGRERESVEEAWRALILRGASLESVEELRAAYRIGGLPAVLRIEIARLEASTAERFEVPARATFLAGKYARLGDRAKTLHWIRVAIDRREDIALHLPTYPEYRWLRGDPEFTRQLERLGLPAR